jgi:septal ring factor EnvC (AmiA/AmiB activator)
MLRWHDLTILPEKNAQLDKLLKQKDSELSKTKSRIQEILAKSNATQKEIAEARGLIGKLNSRIGGYEQQITQLKKQNVALAVERDSVAVTNTDLQQKVNLAKVLHASNIRMKGIKLTSGGRKEKETEKAKRMDLLRIIFDIDENRIAESGSKELNICIINPNGELLSNAALGSGSFKTSDGQSNIILYLKA